MAFRAIRPGELEWITRPHEPDEPARHVAELSELAEFAHTRANLWRYEPGAKGRRQSRVQAAEVRTRNATAGARPTVVASRAAVVGLGQDRGASNGHQTLAGKILGDSILDHYLRTV